MKISSGQEFFYCNRNKCGKNVEFFEEGKKECALFSSQTKLLQIRWNNPMKFSVNTGMNLKESQMSRSSKNQNWCISLINWKTKQANLSNNFFFITQKLIWKKWPVNRFSSEGQKHTGQKCASFCKSNFCWCKLGEINTYNFRLTQQINLKKVWKSLLVNWHTKTN